MQYTRYTIKQHEKMRQITISSKISGFWSPGIIYDQNLLFPGQWDWLIVGRGLVPFAHTIGVWQKQETVWPKQCRWGWQKSFDDPGKEGWPREGSVTRKGREGPAARAAKTHWRRRRGLEKVAWKANILHPPPQVSEIQRWGCWFNTVKCPAE